ncbi:nicotinate phosphoribosyltransferase, partial [Salmonella enterica]|nr:nicotinate phosphoribosyltransferase [Salmonella enterica]
HRRRSPLATPEQAVAHLQTKLAQFKTLAGDLDLSRFKLMDFGTRRRFSQGVQQAIVSTLQAEFPYLSGTSNYDLAHQLGL